MTPPPLDAFADIHTHRPDAGADAIINILPGDTIRPGRWYSIGIHPWDTGTQPSPQTWQLLADTAADPQIVAIGECGLDALRGAPLPQQETIFLRHVQLSEQLHKPLIIHAVRTIHHILRLHGTLRPTQPWIIHGYRGNPTAAAQLIAAGIHLSFGPRHNPHTYAATPSHLRHRETDATP